MPQITNIPDYLTAHGIFIPNDLPFEGPNSELLFKIDLDNHQVVIPSTMSLVDEDGNPLSGGGGSVSAPAGEVLYGTGASTTSSPLLTFVTGQLSTGPGIAGMNAAVQAEWSGYSGATTITSISDPTIYGGLFVVNQMSDDSEVPAITASNFVSANGSYAEVVNAWGYAKPAIGDTVTNLKGFAVSLFNKGAGTVGDMQGLYVDQMNNSGGGTVTVATGLFIANQVAGVTNKAIKTNLGLIDFGDELLLAASTTSRASANIRLGSAPTAPADGDIWLEANTNTGLKIRINGVTKTVTLG